MNNSAASRPLAGIFWMLVTGILFVAVTAVVKHLDGAVPAAQAAFLRYLLGLVFILPMIRPILRARLTKRQFKLFGIRGIVHTLAVMLWFYAMSQIPIAEVTAMNYLSPVYVTIGAALFLGEKLALRRIIAVCVALLGVLIILRPGFREIETGHLAMLGTAVLFAGGYLIAKQMSSEVNPVVIVGMLSLIVTVGLLPFAAAVWVTPTMTQLAWLFLVACFATAGHYTMTLAFAAAPLTVTQPVTFLQLVWATLLGFFLFSEEIDILTVLGGTIILASVVFISWREAKLKRKAVTPMVNATKV
ncbi:DMT family transporter [Parasulfitobacter algicola]|uniref:DMT family transporter n=1 Tax=Parasulfitobacter algicola TaxID=2614809 RepID=A0ABX2J0B0_9RHOB|nr:DMT family transporter [Sulfitobacter algicola]NSX56541.1 DMT family transporter [Sulfitobacter algicola]